MHDKGRYHSLAQDRGDALVDNAAVEHGRIHPDVCGVLLRGGLQNAEVAW
jgi:hypothetical protein